MSRSIAYTSSPLLASPTPVWRSKFIVVAIALGFAGLVGRAPKSAMLFLRSSLSGY